MGETTPAKTLRVDAPEFMMPAPVEESEDEASSEHSKEVIVIEEAEDETETYAWSGLPRPDAQSPSLETDVSSQETAAKPNPPLPEAMLTVARLIKEGGVTPRERLSDLDHAIDYSLNDDKIQKLISEKSDW